RRGGSNRAIGLRADMDALYIQEKNSFDHRSVHDGKMHAYGHDGHTTMLLGAARYHSENSDIDGTVNFIFQPAEEGLAGAKAMMDDGLFEKFPCDAVYGLHNMPGIEKGHIGERPMDHYLQRPGGHGSMPHQGTDPTIAAAQFVLALQTIVSRNNDPLDTAVISLGHIAGGDPGALNIIPSEVKIGGTARSFSTKARELMERRIPEIANAIAAVHGCTAEAAYIR
ncbi:MAG: amidohydrolase, partial [Alphaproteobacteria bacterium]